jgi:GT2 family glycosyltransferase
MLASHPRCASGGRTWWAHVEFTRINITPTILRKKIETCGLCTRFVNLLRQCLVRGEARRVNRFATPLNRSVPECSTCANTRRSYGHRSPDLEDGMGRYRRSRTVSPVNDSTKRASRRERPIVRAAPRRRA